MNAVHMTPLERVAALKAQRRLEEIAKMKAEQRAAEIRQEREAEEFAEAVNEALAREAATWLTEFQCGTPEDDGTYEGRCLRSIRYRIPGHRDFWLQLSSFSGGWERAAVGTRGEMETWAAANSQGMKMQCADLPAALIAAEGVLDEPIPF